MQSETIGALAAALAKAQGAMKPAPKDRDNPFFKSQYSTLAALWESARAAMAANGLAVTQTTELFDSGDIVLITTLIHASGEWVRGVYPIKAVGTKPQELGSAITYARRYAFGAILGLSSDDDDDDGNAASGNGKPQQQPTPARKGDVPTATASQSTTSKVTEVPGGTKATTQASGNGNGKPSAALLSFLNTCEGVFGKDDGARHWIVEKFTAATTPKNVRKSSKELTDDELRKLTTALSHKADHYRSEYTSFVAATFSTAKLAEIDPETATAPEFNR